MNSCMVSLKNIYRVLTVADYPVYSENIFTRKNLRNITLVRFWKQILPYSWRNTAAGKMIWRTEGSSNRLHSELCNRKDSFRYYESYSAQILDVIRAEGLAGPVGLAADFLKDHAYNSEAFRQKISAFLAGADESDPLFAQEAGPWMNGFLELYRNSQIPGAFLDGYFLIMLALHAIAGTSMNSDQMVQFRKNRLNTPQGIYYAGKPEIFSREENIFLTNRNSMLCLPPQGENRFFGRQTEIYDIEEMVQSGGRHLIWGVGGIGKTHLLRICLRGILERKPGRGLRIAVVQFEDSLTESFQRAFLNLESRAAEDVPGEVLYGLNGDRPDQTLLLIDNLDITQLTDADRQLLSQLRCCVIATSRQSSLPGFSPYPVGEIDYESAALIFRNSYGRILDTEEKQQLSQLLHENEIRHPLMLILSGKRARISHLSVKELRERFQEAKASGDITPWQTDSELLRGMYRTAGLTPSMQHLVRIFAVLPYEPCSTARLQNLTGSETGHEDKENESAARFQNMTVQEALAQSLLQLAEEGYLQKSADAWTMHPVISESILQTAPHENEFQDIWAAGASRIQALRREWESGHTTEEILRHPRIGDLSPEEFSIQVRLLVSMAFRIRGPVSRELLVMCEYGILFLAQIQETGYKTLEYLEDLCDRCAQRDEETGLLRYLIRIQGINADHMNYPRLKKMVKEQEAHQTVSDWLFCESFSALCGVSLIREKLQSARAMIEEALTRPVPDAFRDMVSASLHFYLANVCSLEMNADGVCAAAEAVWAVTKKRPGAFDSFLVGADCFAAWTLSGTGQTEKAGVYIEDARVYEKAIRTLELRILYLDARAAVLTGEGNLEEACRIRQEMVRRAAMRSGEGSVEWAMCEATLGLSLYRLGRNEEALRAYRAAVSFFRKQADGSTSLMMTLNNMAVIYLDREQADQALPLLKEAMAIAPSAGEMGVAECSFNLSRAAGLQGDEEEEERQLRACVPVFEKYYGEAHPKTVRSRGRLRELEKSRQGGES